MEGFLDGFADLEEEHIREGFNQGASDGVAAGLTEGAQLGIKQGYELGVELGFYKGCVQAVRQLQKRKPDLLNAKCEKALQSTEALLQAFPLCDPHDERLQDLLAEVQGKFKALVNLLGVADRLDSRKSPASYSF